MKPISLFQFCRNLTLFTIVLAGSYTLSAQVGEPGPPFPSLTEEPSIGFELVEYQKNPVIGKDHTDCKDDKYGFEGGMVIKLHKTYHMFTAENHGDPRIVRMRIAHWTSTDALDWKRQSTIVETTGEPIEVTGRPYASIWQPTPVFNKAENRWDLFCVAYKKSGTGKGFILRFQSTVAGHDGIAGPYKELGVIMQPDKDSQIWEGYQGVATFNPFQVSKRKWLAFYGSAGGHHPEGWLVGLASAPALSGPWKRLLEGNPVLIESVFMENPVVTRIGNLYVIVYDSDVHNPTKRSYFFENHSVGYATSKDGIHWSKGGRITIQPEGEANWSSDIRTPLGLVDEGNGLYTLVYTADSKGDFKSVGMVKLKLVQKNNNLPDTNATITDSPQNGDMIKPAEPKQLRGLPKPKDLPMAKGPFQPTQASLDELYRCPEWFADAKFGFWAHWGPQSVGMNGWYARRMYDPTFVVPLYQQHIMRYGHPSKVGYKDILQLFTADKFDPDALMAEFKEMGARLFLAMGVHHDNYDMWNSKYHRWNAVKIGPHKDIVALWQQAAKKQGLRFGVSTHLCPSYNWWNINKSSDKTGPLAGVPYDGMDSANWDLYHPPHDYQSKHNGFSEDMLNSPEWWKDHCFRRMYDLVTTYQPDFVNENDGAQCWGDAYDPTLVAHYYNMSAAKHGGIPDVVWYGKEGNGKGTLPCGEFALPKLSWRYLWEYETSSTGWYWEGDPAPRVETLVRTFVEVISRNGIFLVSFPQRANGTVPDDHMDCLREMGRWVRLNEEGIFGTRPWCLQGEGPTTLPYDRRNPPKEPYFKKEDIRFTRKKDVIYAFLMNPKDDKVLIRSLGKKARLADGAPQAVRLLGYEGKLNWSQEEEGLKVQLPEAWVERMIPVIEIRGFAAWDGDIRPGLDGQLVLTANKARLNGTKLKQIFGRDFIENWSDPAEWLSWDKVHLLEAGEYEVSIDGGGLRADVPFRLQIGKKALTGKAPAAAAWNNGVVFPAGKITIEKAGVYPVALRAGTNENWGGLQLFNVTLKRMK